MFVIFEFYDQKYVEKLYLKLNLEQPTKQESPYVRIKEKLGL